MFLIYPSVFYVLFSVFSVPNAVFRFTTACIADHQAQHVWILG